MKGVIFSLAFLSLHIAVSFSQISINTDGSQPNPSAMLEVKSNNKGILLPRVADTTVISNPAAGLMIYDLSCNCIRYFYGTRWSGCLGNCNLPDQPSDISGPATPCQGYVGLIYSVTKSNFTNYTWNVPAGWSITAGQGSSVITVSGGIASGFISVTPVNFCGNGPTKTFFVNPSVCSSNITCNPDYGYGTVTAAGHIWHDRNLGASRVAQASTDYYAYGSFFQWGRYSDGHECINWSNSNAGSGMQLTTNTLCNCNSPTDPCSCDSPNDPCGGRMFSATTSTSWFNFHNILNTWWNGPIKGAADPCPIGFRVPTEDELQDLLNSFGQPNAAGAFASPLKLSSAGHRSHLTGQIVYAGYSGNYWSSTLLSDNNPMALTFNASGANMFESSNENEGFSVRCISECEIPDQPSQISGHTSPCSNYNGSDLIYSVNNVTGVTYTWTVPSGMTITSGQGTNSISAIVATAQGYITVVPSNECGSGPASVLEISTSYCNGSTCSFDFNYSTVAAAGYTWFDRNLGASRAGQYITDMYSYGSFFQWGRINDGHECINWTDSQTGTGVNGTTSVQCSNTTPANPCGHNKFITGSTNWTTQGTSQQTWWNGTTKGGGDPCPAGYRIPSKSECEALVNTFSPHNDTGAFNSPIRMVINGGRNFMGTIGAAGEYGNTWSSTYSGTLYGYAEYCDNSQCIVGTAYRGSGFSVRCICDGLSPAQPSAISGDTAACPNTEGLNYSVNNVGGINYNWSVPYGWTITAGQDTYSITITSGTYPGNIAVTPSNSACGNGPSTSMAVTIKTIPSTISSITGPQTPCNNSPGLTYSIPLVQGAWYNWTVPSGWTITSGLWSNQITVTSGTNSGNITVAPFNQCGSSPVSTLSVYTENGVPSQPSTISGSSNPCPNSTLTYSVQNTDWVNYTWSLPSDWTINYGQEFNSINVTSGTSSGSISVTPYNSCGNGTTRSLSVSTIPLPSMPSPIQGPATVCSYSTGNMYNITNVPGLTYNWSVPPYWTITAGQGTYSVTATAMGSGNVSVAASQSSCPSGPSRSLAVTAEMPDEWPGPFNGPNFVCNNTPGYTYSIFLYPGWTSNWTVPTGWTITNGQGTNQITTTSGTASGNISIAVLNTCGWGPTRDHAVTVQQGVPQQPVISGETVTCPDWDYSYSVIDIPGTTFTWTVPSGYTIISGQGTHFIHILHSVNTGGNITVTPSNTCGNGLTASLGVSGSCPEATCSFTFTYGTVSAAGYTWLDRNLGASRVAVSSTDYLAYGHLFQWGRYPDGHQCIHWLGPNSAAAGLVAQWLCTNTTPTNPCGDDMFTHVQSDPIEWSTAPGLYTWWNYYGSPKGPADPCPVGFRVPTHSEMSALAYSFNPPNSIGAFNSPLKLPVTCYRTAYYDENVFQGWGWGIYWDSEEEDLNFNETIVYISGPHSSSNGESVRCISE